MKLLNIFIVSLVFVISSCVSKKKYHQLELDNQSKKGVEDKLKIELSQLNKTIDSLNISLNSTKSELLGYKLKDSIKDLESNSDKNTYSRGLHFSSSSKAEYDKKAIFLYNFISYIQWPDNRADLTFDIGIVGETPLKNTLIAYVYGKSVNKRPIVVENYVQGKSYKIVFFSLEGQSKFKEVKKAMNNLPVLFVSENQALEKMGSHITLNMDGANVRFTANKPILDKSKLKVSNTFYSLAD